MGVFCVHFIVMTFFYDAIKFSLQIWTYAAEGKTLLTPGHSYNAFSESRPGMTLGLVESTDDLHPFTKSSETGLG